MNAADALLDRVRAEATASRIPDEIWPELFSLARRTDTAGLLASRPDDAPGEIADRLRRIRFDNSHRFGLLVIEAQRITDALTRRGVVSAVLKGVGLIPRLYDPGDRSVRDLDLLVEPRDVEDSLQTLAEYGYRPNVSDSMVDIYRRHHFHIPLEGAGRPRIELHWALTRPDDPYSIGAAPLVRRLTTVGGGFRFGVPIAEAQIIHIVVSLTRCGFTELKRLIDLDRLVRSQRIDWAQTVRLAQDGGIRSGLRLSLELTSRLLHTPGLDEVAASIHKPRGYDQLERMGILAFPLGSPTSRRSIARHITRFWLSKGQRGHVIRRFLQRPTFEQHRGRELGISPARALIGRVKRTLRLAQAVAWIGKLQLAPNPHHLVLTKTNPSPPTSASQGEDRARTRGPAA